MHFSSVNTLRPRQNSRHFTDNIFKRIFVNENVCISIKISLTFVPKGPIKNIAALVQIMAWRRPGDKPLSEPMLVSLPTHICITQPQWVKSEMAEENPSKFLMSFSCDYKKLRKLHSYLDSTEDASVTEASMTREQAKASSKHIQMPKHLQHNKVFVNKNKNKTFQSLQWRLVFSFHNGFLSTNCSGAHQAKHSSCALFLFCAGEAPPLMPFLHGVCNVESLVMRLYPECCPHTYPYLESPEVIIFPFSPTPAAVCPAFKINQPVLNLIANNRLETILFTAVFIIIISMIQCTIGSNLSGKWFIMLQKR